MNGLDCLGADEEIGFDYSSLLKGAGGLLSGVAEGFGDKGGGKADSTAVMMEKMRLEEARRQAEKSSSTMKIVLIGLAALLGVGGIVFLVGRKK